MSKFEWGVKRSEASSTLERRRLLGTKKVSDDENYGRLIHANYPFVLYVLSMLDYLSEQQRLGIHGVFSTFLR